jgi:hypothetical protein
MTTDFQRKKQKTTAINAYMDKETYTGSDMLKQTNGDI